MNTTQSLRATTTGGAYGWHGAIKNAEGQTVWECEHLHRNRDTGSWTNGPAARACAMFQLNHMDPEAARAQRGY
jgi:hypothetical protein